MQIKRPNGSTTWFPSIRGFNASYLLSAFKIVFIVVQLLFSWITVFTEYGDEDIRISPSSPLISSVNVNLIQVIYDIRFNHRQCLKGNLRNQNFRSFPSTYLASSWTKNRLAAITAFTWEPKAISRNGFECHFLVISLKMSMQFLSQSGWAASIPCICLTLWLACQIICVIFVWPKQFLTIWLTLFNSKTALS